MKILIDTNILLRVIWSGLTQSQVADDAVAALRRRGDEIVIVPQVMYEFWVVSSRPSGGNGMDRTPAEVCAELGRIRTVTTLLPESTDVYAVWQQLVMEREVRGKYAHDARLAAAMKVHGVESLLTFNVGDFRRFGIQVITPEQVLAHLP